MGTSFSDEARRMALAALAREQDSWVRLDDEVEQRLAASSARRRAGDSTTVVLTVRLDVDEIDALERRAAVMRLKPRALARSLIRAGLRPARSRDLLASLEELERAVERLRELLS